MKIEELNLDIEKFKVRFQIENESLDYDILSSVLTYIISGRFCIETYISPQELEYMINGVLKGDSPKNQPLIFGAGLSDGGLDMGILRPSK